MSKKRRLATKKKKDLCRIYIGTELDRWNSLKKKKGITLHSEVAKLLLDRYSSHAAVSEHSAPAGVSSPPVPAESPHRSDDQLDFLIVEQADVSDKDVKPCIIPFHSRCEIAANHQNNTVHDKPGQDQRGLPTQPVPVQLYQNNTVPDSPAEDQRGVPTPPVPVQLYQNCSTPLSDMESEQTQPHIDKKIKQESSPTQSDIVNNSTQQSSPTQSDIVTKIKQESSPTQPDVANNATQQNCLPILLDIVTKLKQQISSPTQPDIANSTQQSSPMQPNIANKATQQSLLSQLDIANRLTQQCLLTQSGIADMLTQQSVPTQPDVANKSTQQTLLSHLTNVNKLTQQCLQTHLNIVNKLTQQGLPTQAGNANNNIQPGGPFVLYPSQVGQPLLFVSPSLSTNLASPTTTTTTAQKCSPLHSYKSRDLASTGQNLLSIPNNTTIPVPILPFIPKNTTMPTTFSFPKTGSSTNPLIKSPFLNVPQIIHATSSHLNVLCTKSSSISSNSVCQTSHGPPSPLTLARSKMPQTSTQQQTQPNMGTLYTQQSSPTQPNIANSTQKSCLPVLLEIVNKTKQESLPRQSDIVNKTTCIQASLPTQLNIPNNSTQQSLPTQLNIPNNTTQGIPLLCVTPSGQQLQFFIPPSLNTNRAPATGMTTVSTLECSSLNSSIKREDLNGEMSGSSLATDDKVMTDKAGSSVPEGHHSKRQKTSQR